MSLGEKINIIITDEFEDGDLLQKRNAVLDLKTGDVTNLEKKVGAKNPRKVDGYDFSSGELSVGGLTVEFTVSIDDDGDYSVSYQELSQIKKSVEDFFVRKERKGKKNKPL